jgi:hypothetical protein
VLELVPLLLSQRQEEHLPYQSALSARSIQLAYHVPYWEDKPSNAFALLPTKIYVRIELVKANLCVADFPTNFLA